MNADGDEPPEDRERRTRRWIAAGLLVSTFGSIGLLVAYWSDSGAQAEGVGMATAFGGLAVAAGVWGVRATTDRVAVERRAPMPSSAEDRSAAAEVAAVDESDLDDAGLQRRRGLLALAGLAGSSLIAALVSPLRSLGPSPFPERERTSWRAGARLVDAEGAWIRATDLDVGSIATAFPEGDDERSYSQVVVIRMAEGTLDLPEDRRKWTPDGHVAYSKVCTHAGCPVGLYDAQTNELFCPCHQSIFRADEGARPTFGPAARALPQLPIGVDDDGYLIALGDFPEPIGPSYWSRP